MTLFALTKSQETGGFIALAVVLGLVGFYLLLPRPHGRRIAPGIAALIASATVFASWVYRTFGHPLPDLIGTVLFWFFAAGALIFGTLLVVQKNPARGAIAFAFVILSVCGLFLLLAAPFLMAATIIIYAGAIIVTFLFVLMLSRADGPADENDRSREPLYGGFAGFAFIGLVLFALYSTNQANLTAEAKAKEVKAKEATISPIPARLPMPVLTDDERKTLADVITRLDAADEKLDSVPTTPDERQARAKYFEDICEALQHVVGHSNPAVTKGSLRERLEKVSARDGKPVDLYRDDLQVREVLAQATKVREANFTSAQTDELSDAKADTTAVKAQAKQLRDEVVLLYGEGQLPARNVANLGFVLYSEHLLAIELAGTLLLVATIGAIAIAHRKGAAK